MESRFRTIGSNNTAGTGLPRRLRQALVAAWAIATPAAAIAQFPAPRPPATLAVLQRGFAHPPAEARLRCYWWWLNGNTDKPTITHDLEEMQAKGFGGALLVDADGSAQEGNRQVPAGPAFGSPPWLELYTHALKEADRLGLEITLNINSGWNLGGPGVTPEESSKLLTWSRTTVSGGGHRSLALPAPAVKNGFYRQIAVLAYPLHGPAASQNPAGVGRLAERSAAVETGFSMPDSSWMLSAPASAAQGKPVADAAFTEVRNLTSFLNADGTLTWDAPAGDWEILRVGYTDSDARVSTSSGAWQGRALDHMSRTAFDSYWDRTVEPLLTAAKPFYSLKYLATDSWELGGTNWTETFAAEFKARRGYDPLAWLPVLAGRILDSPDRSARFLTDLRRTVADLITANHFDRFAERAAEHGLGVQAESGGPHGAPIDALETFRHSAIPQTEFWSQNPHRSTDVQRFFPKEAASAAHIYGKRIVAAEGETSINEQWSESLATDLKPSFDMAVTEGMNRLVWHEFTSSPAATGLPGQEYFAGTHLNPKVTWWHAGGPFFDYLNRVQFLMQQGVPVDDVLYFYGDNVPNFVRLKADDPAHALPGYDYDVVDEDALLHTVSMEGGILRSPEGMPWRLMVLPSTGRVSLAAMRKIEAYVRAGGTVAGSRPVTTTGMTSAEESGQFDLLAGKLWSACATAPHHGYGKGQVFCTADAHAALAGMAILPDVDFANDVIPAPASTGAFDYVHRRVGATEVYFVRNGSDREFSQDVLFRASGKTPQIWDPVTGTILGVPPHKALSTGQVSLSLQLAPFGSAIVVFPDAPARQPGSMPRQTRTELLVPLQPWTLQFPPGLGAPEAPIELEDLKSWTESSMEGVRYFSGTATYRTEALAPAAKDGESVWLCFAGVREIARVRINGRDAGTVWANPLRLRVDALLKPGRNRIEVEVTNLWPNRIIGDRQPGAAKTFTQTNIDAYKSTSPLFPSGLTGPLSWSIMSPAK